MKYNTLKELFVGICDALRVQYGTTDLIPHQNIPQMILDISGGGSSGVPVVPLYKKQFNVTQSEGAGYISANQWLLSNDSGLYTNYEWQVLEGHYYLVCRGNNVFGDRNIPNRFRTAFFTEDVFETSANPLVGTSVRVNDSSSPLYTSDPIFKAPSDGYIVTYFSASLLNHEPVCFLLDLTDYV